MNRLAPVLPLLGSILVGAAAACGAPGDGASGDQMYGSGAAKNSGTSGATGGTKNGSSSSGSESAGASSTTTNGGGSTTAPSSDDADAGASVPTAIVTDPFASLKQGSDQMNAFCSRGGADAITTTLCNPSTSIASLADLESALGLAFGNPDGVNGGQGNPSFVLLGHSASLGVRTITSANPRVVLMTTPSGWQPSTDVAMNQDGEGPPPGWNPPSYGWSQPEGWSPPTWNGELNTWPPVGWSTSTSTSTTTSNPPLLTGVSLGFSRGQTIVELASTDSSTQTLKMVAVKFEHAAADATSAPDYSPANESNWTSWTAYDDSDLADTTLDCTHCHQPGGAGTTKVLRMNEIATPWTHSMSEWTAGGQALLSDFHSVHGTKESYGGVPAAMIDKSEPDTLELLSSCDGCSAQPQTFDSKTIEDEVHASSKAQPADNSTPGTSATWNALFASSLKTHVLLPYHDVKVTDATKLAAAAASYKSGAPTDLSDLMTDDAKTATLITPDASLDAQTLLGAACADCHNAGVATSLARGRFDATNLAGMTRSEKNAAIGRLQTAAPDIRQMPPANMRELTADQIQALITLLQQ